MSLSAPCCFHQEEWLALPYQQLAVRKAAQPGDQVLESQAQQTQVSKSMHIIATY